VADRIALTRQYGHYGYRRIAALLRDADWQVNDKRVERLWQRGRAIAARSSDDHRDMEPTPQHRASSQCFGRPPVGSGNHRADGI
jgi:hypothetical protein